MDAIVVSLIVFVSLFGTALLGMRLRSVLPEHHLDEESRHLIEIGLGIIGTMAGLVVGLVLGNATSSYNTQRNEIFDVSSKIIQLDRLLAHYGPEADASRRGLRVTVERALNRMWPQEGSIRLDPSDPGAEAFLDDVEELKPKNDIQRSLKPEVIGLLTNLGETRWLMYEQAGSSVSMSLLFVLIFWFIITFAGFGLLAPPNATVIVALGLCTLAISGAVLLLLEMYTPFQGMVQISSAPLRDALSHLGR